MTEEIEAPSRDELLQFAADNLIAMARASVSDMVMPPDPVLHWMIYWTPHELLRYELTAIEAQLDNEERPSEELHNAVVDVLSLRKLLERNGQLGKIHTLDGQLRARKIKLPVRFDATHGGRLP